MANLTAANQWDNVVQLETTDVVMGGAGGKSNEQAQQLLNRTTWLYDRLPTVELSVQGNAPVTLVAADLNKHYTVAPAVLRTFTLPAAANWQNGDWVIIENVSGTTNVVQILPDASDSLEDCTNTVGQYYLMPGEKVMIAKLSGLAANRLRIVSKDYQYLVPVGSVITFPVSSGTPIAVDTQGYLPCDGSAISRDTFARLFSKITVSFGTGNGVTTFNIPNIASTASLAYYIKY